MKTSNSAMSTYIRAREFSISILQLLIIEYGKTTRKYLTDFNIFTSPASKTTGQGNRVSEMFVLYYILTCDIVSLLPLYPPSVQAYTV